MSLLSYMAILGIYVEFQEGTFLRIAPWCFMVKSLSTFTLFFAYHRSNVNLSVPNSPRQPRHHCILTRKTFPKTPPMLLMCPHLKTVAMPVAMQIPVLLALEFVLAVDKPGPRFVEAHLDPRRKVSPCWRPIFRCPRHGNEMVI